MDVVSAARALIGDTLAFHLLFVLFGVTLPLLISATEGYGIWKKKPRLISLARSWSKALVVLFIAGAVSGTIVSLQFSLLWPTFTEFAGKVVGISFALEGFAFMVEAVFLSVYMLSWDRFKPLQHWLCSLPVVLGAITSALFITTVNAWMNTPRGFELDAQGNPININTREAIFNPSTAHEVTHSILSYFFATVLIIMAVYAWLYLRRNFNQEIRGRLSEALRVLAILAVVFGLAIGASGDRAGKSIAEHQPYKLAAAEGLAETQEGAPLKVGGVVDGDEVKYALQIPKLLSFLATGDINGKVTGLNDIPKDERPLLITHYFFDGMVGIGIIATLIPAAYLAFRKWRKSFAHSRLMMRLFVACGFLGLIAVELGWMLTEFGRQPYVIYGVMRTEEAATRSEAAIHLAYLFPILYLVLFVVTLVVLKKVFRPMEALEK